MIFDFNNILSLFRSKKIVKAIKNTDVFVFARKNSTLKKGYEPVAMEGKDLTAAILKNIDPSAFADLNTADFTNVAFVSNAGNNGTAVIGNANLPYSTVTAAQSAGASKIIIEPGNYYEQVTLVSGTKYYCMPGVQWLAGGLRSPGVLTDTHWLGEAEFSGNYQQLYLLSSTLTGFVFRCHSMTETGSAAVGILIQGTGTCDVDIEMTHFNGFGGSAYSIRFQGSVSGRVVVHQQIQGYYGVIHIGQTNPLDGDLTIQTPRLVLLDGGYVGNNAAFKQAVYVLGMAVGSQLHLDCEIHVEVVGALASVAGGIVASIGSGTIYVNGNVYGNDLRGIVMSMSGGKMMVKGDLQSNDNAFYQTNGETVIKGSTLLTGDSLYLSGAATVFYMEKCTVYDKTDGNSVISHLASSNAVYITNSNMEATGGASCIDTGGNGYSAGLINVHSNVANEGTFVEAYAVAGFTQEASLSVPKIN